MRNRLVHCQKVAQPKPINLEVEVVHRTVMRGFEGRVFPCRFTVGYSLRVAVGGPNTLSFSHD